MPLLPTKRHVRDRRVVLQLSSGTAVMTPAETCHRFKSSLTSRESSYYRQKTDRTRKKQITWEFILKCPKILLQTSHYILPWKLFKGKHPPDLSLKMLVRELSLPQVFVDVRSREEADKEYHYDHSPSTNKTHNKPYNQPTGRTTKRNKQLRPRVPTTTDRIPSSFDSARTSLNDRRREVDSPPKSRSGVQTGQRHLFSCHSFFC